MDLVLRLRFSFKVEKSISTLPESMILSLGAVELKGTFILRLFYSAMVNRCVVCHIKLLFRSETINAAKVLN